MIFAANVALIKLPPLLGVNVIAFAFVELPVMYNKIGVLSATNPFCSKK